MSGLVPLESGREGFEDGADVGEDLFEERGPKSTLAEAYAHVPSRPSSTPAPRWCS